MVRRVPYLRGAMPSAPLVPVHGAIVPRSCVGVNGTVACVAVVTVDQSLRSKDASRNHGPSHNLGCCGNRHPDTPVVAPGAYRLLLDATGARMSAGSHENDAGRIQSGTSRGQHLSLGS